MDFAEAAVRGVILAGMVVAFWIVVRLIKAIVRRLRSVTAEGVARTAGNISARVESKAASVGQAFKRGRDDART